MTHNPSPRLVYQTIYGIVPWWILAGSSIAGRTVLVGSFDLYELDAIRQISGSLLHFEFSGLDSAELDGILDGPATVDVLIVKALERDQGLQFLKSNGVVKRLVKVSACALLLESNPAHLRHMLRRPLGVLGSVVADFRWNRLKKCFPAHHVEKLETLTYGTQPHEAFPTGTYYTNKNTFLRTEKIKRLLLNSRLSRMLFSTQIWVLSNRQESSYLGCLMEAVKTNPEFEWETTDIRLKKVIFGGKKVIVSLTSRRDNKPEYIVVTPVFQNQVEQRINEQKAIEHLNSASSISEYFVDRIIVGTADHLQYFAMAEFDGVTVDKPHSCLPKLTSRAVAVINRFVDCFAADPRPRQPLLPGAIAADYCESLLSRYPFHEEIIRRVQAKFLGLGLHLPPVGFMHGDMKLENFVVDSRLSEVIGVIDLELAEFPGIPLVDLCYLIRYNYYIRYGESFYTSFVRLTDSNLSPEETGFIDDYCRMVGLTSSQKDLALAIFYLHHFARRFFFIEEESETNREFVAGCELILAMLENLPVDSGASETAAGVVTD